VLATGYKAELIDAYVRAHPPQWPVRTVAEAEPLGTGGGMKNAGDGMTDPFLLLNADVIAAVNIPDLLLRHQEHGGIGTMTLAEVSDTRPYGVAALGPDDRITEFVEKPEPEVAPSHWINAGIGVWGVGTLDAIPPGRPVSFEREVVPGLLERGVYGFRLSRYWEDAGTPERLLNAQRLLFDDGRGGKPGLPRGALGTGPVAAAPGATVAGASFGKYVTLGPGVTVEPGAHVENSVVMDGAHVERDAFVAGSLVGPRARVRPNHRVVGQTVGEGAEV
jgi:mannose-1-phosphate guanylyltransferase